MSNKQLGLLILVCFLAGVFTVGAMFGVFVWSR